MWFQDERIAQMLSAAALHYYRDEKVIPQLHPFSIPVSFPATVAGATAAPIRAEVDAEGDYIWLGNSCGQIAGANLTPNLDANVLLRVKLTQTDRRLGDAARNAAEGRDDWIPLASFSGSVENPFYFAWPIIIRAGAGVLFTLHNGTAASRTEHLVMLGYRVLEVPRFREVA